MVLVCVSVHGAEGDISTGIHLQHAKQIDILSTSYYDSPLSVMRVSPELLCQKKERKSYIYHTCLYYTVENMKQR